MPATIRNFFIKKVSGAESGQQELSLEYGETEVTTPVTLVNLSLQAGTLNLNRGESTYLDVSVAGLKEEKAQLEKKIFLIWKTAS